MLGVTITYQYWTQVLCLRTYVCTLPKQFSLGTRPHESWIMSQLQLRMVRPWPDQPDRFRRLCYPLCCPDPWINQYDNCTCAYHAMYGLTLHQWYRVALCHANLMQIMPHVTHTNYKYLSLLRSPEKLHLLQHGDCFSINIYHTIGISPAVHAPCSCHYSALLN